MQCFHFALDYSVSAIVAARTSLWSPQISEKGENLPTDLLLDPAFRLKTKLLSKRKEEKYLGKSRYVS
jgi:hypothetical protein